MGRLTGDGYKYEGRYDLGHDDAPDLARAWLEGEGERQRRPAPLPPQVGDPAVRGWVHVGVCALGGALAAGLFVCWLATAWHRAGLRGAGHPAGPAGRGFGVGWAITLEGVRVEGISRDSKAGGGPGPLTLTVSHRGRSMACEFREGKAPRGIRVGDTVSIRGAAGRVEGETDRVLLKDCEVVEGPRRPGE